MTQAEFAVRVNLSAKALNQIIRGHAPITQETALRFEAVTDIPARTWNALEAVYAEDKARLKRNSTLAQETDFLTLVPVKALRDLGFVTEPANDKIRVLEQVLDFFGVADTHAWHELWQAPAAAYRRSPAFKSDPGAVATWLRLGEIDASRRPLRMPFRKSALRKALGSIRSLTLTPDPSVFVPELDRLLGETGVTVVFIPEVTGARCSGATRWITGRPLVQLSLRHKSDDHLWFTLFHELGHVLLHPRTDVYIDGGPQDGASAAVEEEANAFARDTLIPPDHGVVLSTLRRIDAIKDFAEAIGVSPGVVVGRLQHDGVIDYRTGNALKTRYRFTGHAH